MGVTTIAFNTFREAVRAKAYYVIVIAGLLMLFLWVLLPFYTQGAEVGVLKEMQMGTITVLGVVMSILVAGTVVTSELSDKTAMTLLSKPITRAQFVAGKFFGVLLTVLSAVFVLSLAALLTVWLRGYMEIQPTGGLTYEDSMARMRAERWYHVQTMLPGLAMVLMQVGLIASVAVTLAVRLPFALNALAVTGLYVLGHLLGWLRETAPAGAGRTFLIALTVPIAPLRMYNVGNEIGVSDFAVPWSLVAKALVYTVLYGAALLLVAMALFRERELS